MDIVCLVACLASPSLDPCKRTQSLPGRLYGIHLKDFAEMKDKTEGVILGKGHLNVEEVFTELQLAGFPANGAVSLEYEENPKNPLADIRECVKVAKTAMKAVAENA